MQTEKRIFSKEHAEKFRREFLCSRCWGPLDIQFINENEMIVVCYDKLEGLCDGAGFISEKSVLNKQMKNFLQFLEVIRNYPDLPTM